MAILNFFLKNKRRKRVAITVSLYDGVSVKNMGN